MAFPEAGGLAMKSSAWLEKAWALGSILGTRPVEFYDRVAGIAANSVDALFRKAPDYPSVAWGTAIEELKDVWPRIDASLIDPVLHSLESRVQHLYAQAADDAWEGRYSADIALGRCLYIVCRALRPTVVIETGVAYGMSSAFILQALEQNAHGTLYSIDLPPLGGEADTLVGAVVPTELRSRWVLRRGTSQRLLPELVRQGPVDLFIHDSLHTHRNMRREFDTAWPNLRPGGVVISDDIEGNAAFAELRRRPLSLWLAIRQEGKPALMGLAVKSSQA
jgi:predicted O-methyltransferase YrrM